MQSDSINKITSDNSNKGFDVVAEKFSSLSGELPSDYIDLIQKTFGIKKKDNIIDLGCGSGLLTFKLRNLSDNVQGLDVSSQMIRIARRQDADNHIDWICKPVEEFTFKEDFYSLIISFESFHLFPEQSMLIKRCHDALKNHGYICIGWFQHHWEELFKPYIVESFGSFGIPWNDWGFQTCPHFSDIIRQRGLLFSDLQTKSVIIHSKSDVHYIAQYLSCINKALVLSREQRMNLAESLEKKFIKLLSSNYISGESKYFIKYVSKIA